MELATDAQFQAFIASAGIPVEDDGIAEWSFDDRCGIINHALRYGLAMPFVEVIPNIKSSAAEQKETANNSEQVAMKAARQPVEAMI